MKSTGLIVEYNPFHNGHKYHLKKGKEVTNCDVIIGVMSGDYVQRGEPAGLNRWKRAEIALLSGVDLVVELPLFYSTQNAEIFAKGAVDILHHLGVDSIVFGSESGDIRALEKVASIEESQRFKELLQEKLKEGVSYPKGYSMVLEELGLNFEINSNDILGIEYIKSAKNYNINMVPIKRIGARYHESDIVEGISSATGIRKIINEINSDISNNINPNEKIEILKKLIPSESHNIILENLVSKKGIKLNRLEDFYPLIRYEILNNMDNLKNIQDIDEGLDYKFYESAKKNRDYQNFYNEIKSKRYTIGRIQRALIHILLGVTKELTQEVKGRVPYIKILGFSKNGQKYLKELKKKRENNNDTDDSNQKNQIEIISSLSNIRRDLKRRDRELLEFNEKGSIIYQMIDDYEDRKIPIMIEQIEKVTKG